MPQLPTRLVQRSALRGRLDADFNMSRMVVVLGVVASGKTVLVRDWLESRPDVTAVWVRVDEGDTDSRSLWAALGTGVARATSQPAGSLVEVTERDGWTVADSVAAVVNVIDEWPHPLALVLDGVHLAGHAVASLESLIEHLPDTACVIVTTAARLPLPIAGMRANGLVTTLDDTDLRMSTDDVAAIADALDVDVSTAELAEVVANSEGWVGAVVLDLTAARTPSRPLGRPPIDDLLDGEVLAPLPVALRNFLDQLAIFESFTVDDVRAVIGGEEVETLIAELERRNLFLERLTVDRFRLHRLLRERLLERLDAGQSDRAELHRRAAAWYEQQNAVGHAVRHLTAAGDDFAATVLASTHVSSSYYQGDGTAVHLLLGELDAEAARADPTGRSQSAMAAGLCLRGQLADSNRWLAEFDVRGILPPPDVAGRIAMTRAALALFGGDLEAAFVHFDEVLRPAVIWSPFERMIIDLFAIKAHAWRRDFVAAGDTYERARTRPGIEAAADLFLAGVYGEVLAFAGRLREADDLVAWAMQLAVAAQLTDHCGLHDSYRARGLLAYERGRLDEADEALHMSLRRSGTARPFGSALANIMLARVRLAQGRLADARAAVAAARTFISAPAGTPLHDFATGAEIRVAIAANKLDEARRLVATLAEPARLRAAARVHLAAGEVAAARFAIESLDSPLTIREGIDRVILAASIEVAAGRDDLAVPLVLEAVTLAEEEVFVQPFVEDGDALRDVLRDILAREPRTPFSQALRDVLASAARRRHSSVGGLAERERQVLALLADSASPQQIARQLSMSMATVRTHISAIYRKLRANSREEALAHEMSGEHR